MAIPTFEKYEDENKAYGIDWSKVLSNANNGAADTISSSAWTIAPSGLTNVSDTVDSGNTRAIIRVSGGTVGEVYILQNAIVLTTSGYTLEKRITLRIKDSI